MKTNVSARLARSIKNVPNGWLPENVLAHREEFSAKVIFDLHGPVLDFMTPFYAHAGKMFGVKFDMRKIRYWYPQYDKTMPITPQQYREAFADFARRTKDGFGSLPARPGIQQAIKQIRNAGIDVEIWTCVPGALDVDRDTQHNTGVGIAQDVTRKLIDRLGLVDDVMTKVRFCDSADAKLPLMRREPLLPPLIVEDHPKTCVDAGVIHGLAAIMVPEPYNLNVTCPGVLPLKDRADLAPAVIHFFTELEKAGCLVGGLRKKKR
ncbi:MAG: hypothetical protein K2W82_15920 [Candidatus Obscuribacterales bacterium]|nr:hypothetical protein [Candidatus Obscuribacterales bacterium]